MYIHTHTHTHIYIYVGRETAESFIIKFETNNETDIVIHLINNVRIIIHLCNAS